MRLFLSYASPDKRRAEAIHLALLGAGHEVFFDDASLPPGGDYHSRIRTAIDESDAFVFLVSPHSVTPGHYALTELEFAKTKWRKPWGFVLPVMITPTEHNLIDQYLASVTIMQPRGDAAAEVAAAVLSLRESIDASRSIMKRERSDIDGPKFLVSASLEVIQQDLLSSSGGMLVCPVNPTLIMSDGIQLKVRKLVGLQLQVKLLRYAFRFPLGEARVERGNEVWPYVALANSSGRPGRRACSVGVAIDQIVYTVLGKAHALEIGFIHTPLLGSGFGGLADEQSLEHIRVGLENFKAANPACNITVRIHVHDPERFIALRKLLQEVS